MGAWIEIMGGYIIELIREESHPTMGAWIEIVFNASMYFNLKVAPHDGCVDWNPYLIAYQLPWLCRTPRWVRGLK